MRPWPRSLAEAGKSFDPKVVAILNRRYVELEKLANAAAAAGSGETVDRY